jgi:hypothetical protein
MTPHAFTQLFLLGAAALAIWVYARWPRLTPSTLWTALLHVAAATLAAPLCVPVVRLLASYGTVPTSLLAVFAVALPVLTYMLLVALWVLATLRAAMYGR